jgi:hypothetical protein
MIYMTPNDITCVTRNRVMNTLKPIKLVALSEFSTNRCKVKEEHGYFNYLENRPIPNGGNRWPHPEEIEQRSVSEGTR